MRNLRNIALSTWRSPHNHEHRQITTAAWDIGTDSVICAYGPTENDTLIELVRVTFSKNSDSSDFSLLTSWNAAPPNPDMIHDKILDLHYFQDTLTICLVLAGGDIIVISEWAVEGEGKIEIVGSVDAGITAATWSHDEELLAISTKAKTFLIMSRSFDCVIDITLNLDDLKVSDHVSVGWGRKETQFMGKGVKALRDPTIPEKTDEGTVSPHDNGGTTISWRGDDAFVAISTIEAGVRRLIRVYSRDGILDGVSEPVDGLEGALSWRPVGNLIASVQGFSDHVDIVLFERNGLRHGHFSLRLSSKEVMSIRKEIRLSWNYDSSILAVVLGNTVQLWTMVNYHWYLKQELVIPPQNVGDLHTFIWHTETALRFIVATTDRLITAEYVFCVTRGSTTPPNDFGAVAVIDGEEVKITAFRTANIPPPMALHTIGATHNVADVAFGFENKTIAILHQSGIAIYGWDVESNPSAPPILIGDFDFEESDLAKKIPLQVCVDGNQNLLVLQHLDEGKTTLHRYCLSGKTGKVEEKAVVIPGISPIMTISSFFQDGIMHPFVQHASGHLYSLKSEPNNMALVNANFPMFLPWAELAIYNETPLIFGLSRIGHLYANSRLLTKNCTSFLLTPLHLAFTTTHLLKFVHITNIEDLEIPPDNPEKDERCRSIERGARLVSAMPSSLNLVLQMPRGNLETIWPRAMVLAGIRKLIQDKRYREAYAHCRMQRVDMNILYDHSPEQFMSSIGLFIDQIKNVSYIDLFLSSLREADVSQTLYRETCRSQNCESVKMNEADGILSTENPVGILKVNRICDAFLEVLKDRKSLDLQNIITANMCKIPPALEGGLLVVASLMEEKEELVEKAVEHICFLADVNKLYDTALGLYNFDLALLIAQRSQKDPREYLPFLQRLQEMPHRRRYFSIDDYLGRYPKALSHLFELSLSSNDHSEFEAYTVKHTLYQDSLAHCRYLPSQMESIMSLYASYLESQSQFREAAIAYEYLGRYELASTCYQRASPSYWRECIFCASQKYPRPSQEAMKPLAAALADSLTEASDFESAAYIHTTYLSSIPTAIALLCKGYQFASAIQLASLHSSTSPALITPSGPIDVGLGDAFSTSTELLVDCKSQLLAQIPRIRELRLKAAADPLVFYEGEVNDNLPDDISVAASSRFSTSASLFTRYTGRQSLGTAATGMSRITSKNRRREERKRARGKRGSAYEEEYLVASVRRLVERVESARADVEKLVIGLVRRRMRERAMAVEALLLEVLDMCRDAVKTVFDEDMNETMGGIENEYRPVGGDAVLAESVKASRKRGSAPIIGIFDRLSILGPEQ